MAWYSKVEFKEGVKFEQGDFIRHCPFYLIVNLEDGKAKAVTSAYDVVVITQSCDLENDKADRVLVAPSRIKYSLNKKKKSKK